MTTNVISTLTNALPYGAQSKYPNEYEAVTKALTEREYELTDAITEAVVQHFGVTTEQVRDRLAGLGMAIRPEPTPEPEPEVDVAELELAFAADDSTATSGEEAPVKVKKDKSVKALAKRIKALEKLAKDHGLL